MEKKELAITGKAGLTMRSKGAAARTASLAAVLPAGVMPMLGLKTRIGAAIVGKGLM
jgi:hypothetical protein